MSHSGVPGIEDLGNFMAGDDPPKSRPAPAPPSLGDETQKAEEERRMKMGRGQSANMIYGPSDNQPTVSSKNVLLGS